MRFLQILGSYAVELHFKSDELDILESKWLTDSIVSAYQRIKKNSSSYWAEGGGGGVGVARLH